MTKGNIELKANISSVLLARIQSERKQQKHYLQSLKSLFNISDIYPIHCTSR